jgi:uncharacterized protein YjbJ (UPF0337 family)
MARTRHRGHSEGTLDRFKGRVLELISKVTGKLSAAVAGKAYRARGRAKATKGRATRGRG